LNRILTAVESADRQLHGVSLSEWEGEAPSYTDRPINDPQEIVVAREEILRWTEHAQKLLSDLEQKVFSLYLRGYSYCEMSEILQTSEKTIDNALQRVRKKMREGHELR
jgi:RNA polymerase sporulation-specific sigma factor